MNTTNQTLNDTAGSAPKMKRDDYKAIKHMNKDQMTAYLQRIYMRGYKKGLEDAGMALSPKKIETPDSPAE